MLVNRRSPENRRNSAWGKSLKSSKLTKENLGTITEFLESLKVVDPDDPSISPSKAYIPTKEDVNLGVTLLPKYNYNPYYGENPDF